MAKKHRPAEPVTMRKKETNTILQIDSITATRMSMPVYQAQFKTGRHQTEKDRPREKNWRMWM